MSAARDTSDRLRAIADEAFAATPAPKGAALRITPPFPAAWPPDGAVVVYLYVTHFAAQLSDGEMTSPPFARVRLDGNGDVTLEQRDDSIGATSPQGVFPITREHPLIAMAAPAITAIRAAREIPTGEAAAAMRTFFRAWLDANGVVALQIRPHHAAFCAWLQP